LPAGSFNRICDRWLLRRKVVKQGKVRFQEISLRRKMLLPQLVEKCFGCSIKRQGKYQRWQVEHGKMKKLLC
jgi:hypothetical protein